MSLASRARVLSPQINWHALREPTHALPHGTPRHPIAPHRTVLPQRPVLTHHASTAGVTSWKHPLKARQQATAYPSVFRDVPRLFVATAVIHRQRQRPPGRLPYSDVTSVDLLQSLMCGSVDKAILWTEHFCVVRCSYPPLINLNQSQSILNGTRCCCWFISKTIVNHICCNITIYRCTFTCIPYWVTIQLKKKTTWFLYTCLVWTIQGPAW